VFPGVSVHQLGGNPDTVDRPTNAAFHDIGDAEVTCDVPYLDRLGL
jgi:hypothetical protein